MFDAEGRGYLDACGGAAVSCLGHGHPAVTAAMVEQLQALAFGYSGVFTTEALEDLARVLTDAAPAPLSRAFFVSGGSEAMEAALKIGRQYYLEIGQPQAPLHLPPPELSRQYAGRPLRQRPRRPARAL